MKQGKSSQMQYNEVDTFEEGVAIVRSRITNVSNGVHANKF